MTDEGDADHGSDPSAPTGGTVASVRSRAGYGPRRLVALTTPPPARHRGPARMAAAAAAVVVAATGGLGGSSAGVAGWSPGPGSGLGDVGASADGLVLVDASGGAGLGEALRDGLGEVIARNDLDDIRVELVELDLGDDDVEARRLGTSLGASVVVWESGTAREPVLNVLTTGRGDEVVDRRDGRFRRPLSARAHDRFPVDAADPPITPVALFTLVEALVADGRPGPAATLNEVALDASTGAGVGRSAGADHLLAATHLQAGNLAFRRADHRAAVVAYSEALSLEPGYALAAANRAGARDELGDHGPALDDIDHAIELEPAGVTFYVDRGIIRFRSGDAEGAVADLDEAIALDRDSAVAWFDRAAVANELGDPGRAIRGYNRALELEGATAAVSWLGRGDAYRDLGDLEQALADYDRAVALDPDSALAHLERGGVHDDLGDYDLALADYDRAVALDPDWADPHISRGLTEARTGDHDAALGDIDRAIELLGSGRASPGTAGTTTAALRRLRDTLQAGSEDVTETG